MPDLMVSLAQTISRLAATVMLSIHGVRFGRKPMETKSINYFEISVNRAGSKYLSWKASYRLLREVREP